MASASLLRWQNDRLARLRGVDAHCAAVEAAVPPNPLFLDETLRGFVLHLSAHFQGFCRDLYTECSQICVSQMPVGVRATAQAQFSAQLALEKGNPNHHNSKKDFDRFGISLSFPTFDPRWLTDLDDLNKWRNKAAHQGTQVLAIVLTAPRLRAWQAACDGLAGALDGIMYNELNRILGLPPW